MRVLVSSSRMPFALDEIRKLGKEGHFVVATDTFRNAPGSHSKFAATWATTASPRYATRNFIADIAQIVQDHAIELVLPAFEEVFYLSKHAGELEPNVRLFASPFETLARLHDKVATRSLAEELRIPVPRTTVVKSREELREAIARQPAYFARPSFSRGGVQLLTNTGPLAGSVEIETCDPTAQNPWLVQEFVDGTDICTFSIAQHGKLAAHATYVHPREIEHAGGIVFESIRDLDGLEYIRRIVEATSYHGQISFDFRRTPSGLVLLECNPRPTAGVMMLSPAQFSAALFDEQARTLRIAEPGIRKKFSVALVRDMILHWKEIPKDLKHLLSGASEFYAEPGDVLPALYQFLSYTHVLAYRKDQHPEDRKGPDLMAAYFYDVLWNGDPIE